MTQIDKEAVERLARTLKRHSAKHMLDAADTLLALRAALDAAEAEKRAAVEVAYNRGFKAGVRAERAAIREDK